MFYTEIMIWPVYFQPINKLQPNLRNIHVNDIAHFTPNPETQ